jgi:hypothetical protein
MTGGDSPHGINQNLERVPIMSKTVYLNFGLHSNNPQGSAFKNGVIPAAYVLDLIRGALFPGVVYHHEARESNTEPTLIVAAFVADLDKLARWLKDAADVLEQDAIAALDVEAGEGRLIHGERARNNWGDFNAAYFLMPERFSV